MSDHEQIEMPPPEEPTLVEEVRDHLIRQDRIALAERVGGRPPSGNHSPSKLGHPCARNYWYQYNRWEDRADMPAEVGGSFWLGDVLEGPIADRVQGLLQPEYEVLRVRKFLKIPRKGGRPIVGKLDRIVRRKRDGATFLLEIKTTGAYHLPKLTTVEEILSRPEPWLRGYPFQVRCYVAACIREKLVTERDAMIIFIGLPRGALQPVWFPWSQLEPLGREISRKIQIAEKAPDEEALDKLERGGRIEYDPRICGFCDWQETCLPKRVGPQAQVLEAPRVLALLGRLEELHREDAPAKAKELAALEKEIKELVRPAGPGEHFSADGRWHVKIQAPAKGQPRLTAPEDPQDPAWVAFLELSDRHEKARQTWLQPTTKASVVKIDRVWSGEEEPR